MYCRADPPHGVGRQAEALVGLEALDGLHQTDVAFGHDLADRQAVAAIAHGDLGDEAQMRGDELVGGGGILMLAPTLGEHVFLLRLQNGELANFRQIPRKTAFARYHGQGSSHLLLRGPRFGGPLGGRENADRNTQI